MNYERSEYEKLLWDVRRSVRYHMHRVRSFDNRSRVATGVAVLFGSVAGAAALGKAPDFFVAACSGTVAAIATIDLVTNNARKAREHSDLARRFGRLERKLVSVGSGRESYTEFVDIRLEIEEDEAPIMRVLDLLCHNELADSEGLKDHERYEIRWYERLMAPLLAEFCLEAIKRRYKTKLASLEASSGNEPPTGTAAQSVTS